MAPNLLIALLVILGIYFLAMSRIASQLPASHQRRHLGSFILGLLVTLIVFIPSPDLLGPDHRFTVSMGQMLLAIDLGPLLLFSGIPEALLQPFQKWDALMRNLAKPLLVGFASAVILFGWFVPVLFEAASSSLPLWIFKQMLFVISGFLFWWPVASPLSMWKPTYLVQLAYLFIMRAPMMLLGIMFTFADKLIYTSRSFSLEICAPSSLSDQQAGGLVVWIMGGLIIFAIFSLVLIRFFKADSVAEP